MSDNKCTCTMTASALGDGCRYCNPQFYIDMLEEQFEDLQDRIEILDLWDALEEIR